MSLQEPRAMQWGWEVGAGVKVTMLILLFEHRPGGVRSSWGRGRVWCGVFLEGSTASKEPSAH